MIELKKGLSTEVLYPDFERDLFDEIDAII